MNKAREFPKAFRMVAVAALCAVLAGCASQQKQNGSALANGGIGAGGPVTPGTERDFSVNVGNTVYFTTDSTTLTPEAQRTLRSQANWLNKYPRFTITLEGHADERGTREYNIALGA